MPNTCSHTRAPHSYTRWFSIVLIGATVIISTTGHADDAANAVKVFQQLGQLSPEDQRSLFGEEITDAITIFNNLPETEQSGLAEQFVEHLDQNSAAAIAKEMGRALAGAVAEKLVEKGFEKVAEAHEKANEPAARERAERAREFQREFRDCRWDPKSVPPTEEASIDETRFDTIHPAAHSTELMRLLTAP